MLKKYFAILIFFTTTISAFATDEAGHLHINFHESKIYTALQPPYVSSVCNSNNDPLQKEGFFIDVLQNDKPIEVNEYSVEFNISNTSIVSKENIFTEKRAGIINIKIKTIEVGHTNIDIKIHYKNQVETLTVYLASSKNEINYPTFYHTGYADASAVLNINDSLMLVGDDENNVLSVYQKNKNGLPIQVFEYDNKITIASEFGKEMDCEACVQSPFNKNISYWIGSMGNGGKNYEEKPLRNNIICVDVTQKKNELKLTFKDNFNNLRKHIIDWGNKNNFNFSKCAGVGEKPKQINGFNIEGLCFAPDSTTLWIGFRAPLLPTNNRTKALIAPIKNFEKWFNSGHKNKQLEFGEPIELNLEGKGIRDIIQLSNKQYLIVAGNATEVKDAALFLWSGVVKDLPKKLDIKGISNLNLEGVCEVGSTNNTIKIILVCDDGSTDFYDDNIASKHIHTNLKKFRSIEIFLK